MEYLKAATGMGILLFSILQFINIKNMEHLPIKGTYIFSKQEMVAGFNFLPDGKFTFFFSYGAIDRTATGTFVVEDDTIKIKSNKEAGKDFTITHQEKNGSGYKIKLEDPNSYLLTNILITFFIGTERHDEYTDEKGEIRINMSKKDSGVIGTLSLIS